MPAPRVLPREKVLRNHLTCLIAVSALALSACASMKYGDKDVEASLKKLEPVPEKASLYVCREQALLFSAGVRTVAYVDGEPIGTLKPNTFAQTVVAPGKHEIYLRKDGLATGNSGVLSVDASVGEVVIVWAGVTGGGFGALTVDRFEKRSDAESCVKGAAYSVRAE